MSKEIDAETQAILDQIRDSVVDGESDKCVELTRKAVDQKIVPHIIMDEGLLVGMRIIGEKWDLMEIFLPEAMLAAAAMKGAMEIVLPLLKAAGEAWEPKGIVVIGTVKGDLHDIGKTIVANIMSANGFEVHDLGTNVPPDRFLEAAEQMNADIIGCSALMTTTMPMQRNVVEFLEATGLRDRYIVMVGGAPTTAEWIEEIAADGWGRDAYDACAKALSLIGKKKGQDVSQAAAG